MKRSVYCYFWWCGGRFSQRLPRKLRNSSSISGTVLDPSGATVASAVVTIHNSVSQFERSATTDSAGKFSFPNVPFNPIH